MGGKSGRKRKRLCLRNCARWGRRNQGWKRRDEWFKGSGNGVKVKLDNFQCRTIDGAEDEYCVVDGDFQKQVIFKRARD